MFSEPYLYYFLIVSFMAHLQLRMLKSPVLPPAGLYLFTWISGLGTLARIVFLILGFWFMPAWWYPLAMFGLGLATSIIPIPDRVGALLGVVAVPLFSVLMYLDLFAVI
jgi:hypothetical protein